MPKRTPRATGSTPVEDALRELEPAYVECRDIAHAWSVDGYRAGDGGNVLRRLVCGRCGTERTDTWTLGGARVQSGYRYASGYALRDVDYPTDRMALRREVLRRAGVLTRTGSVRQPRKRRTRG